MAAAYRSPNRNCAGVWRDAGGTRDRWRRRRCAEPVLLCASGDHLRRLERDSAQYPREARPALASLSTSPQSSDNVFVAWIRFASVTRRDQAAERQALFVTRVARRFPSRKV